MRTNDYSIGWRESGRLLARTNRRKGRRYLPYLLIVLLAWGWMMDRQYQEEQVAKARVQEATATQLLLDCMNGKAKWVSEDEKQLVACDVWSTTL